MAPWLERSVASMIPADFPYAVRCVSDILGSNGSSSMASVCGATLALMDAGVPMKKPVAGISVGLVTGTDGRRVFLTDILGSEDHYGDMDFKLASTRDGITASSSTSRSPASTWPACGRRWRRTASPPPHADFGRHGEGAGHPAH